jgi:hypothetical protein
MKSTRKSVRTNSVARLDIGALRSKSTKIDDTIKRNLSGARRSIEQLRKSLDKFSETLKDLESQDSRWGIQNLMSKFNEAEALAQGVWQKWTDIASELRKIA